MFLSFLGWKSKGLKSKGHSKSKGFKAFKGTKAKSYIHKGLTKRSAEPGLGWNWSIYIGFYWKGHFKAKCDSWKGKPYVYTQSLPIRNGDKFWWVSFLHFPDFRIVSYFFIFLSSQFLKFFFFSKNTNVEMPLYFKEISIFEFVLIKLPAFW